MLHSRALLVAFAPAGGALAGCTALETPAPGPEQHVASADGVSIAWEQRGSGTPALVFVHGWCGERGLWRATLDAFEPTQRVLALDLAGHGASGAARADWTLASLADDVVAVVEASGAEDVILVGHSMGAPVALLAAPRLAPRVRGVIAVDALHRADFAYPPGFLAEAARGLEADFPRAVDASLRAVLPPTAPPELLEWLRARALRTDREAAVALLRGLEDFRLGEALAAAGVPVRVIDAGAEPVAEVEQNRRLCDYDALVMEGSGHFPMLEQPDAFQARLAHWIEQLPPARPDASR